MYIKKINEDNKILAINLLKNVNGLKLENEILNNCLLLLNNKDDIVGTISYEKYDKYAIIRYFVFKKNIDYKDLLNLYNYLEKQLSNININNVIAIINSNEVKEVFEYLGFNKIDKNKIYFDETKFCNTNYKNNDVYLKKCNNYFLY